MTINQLSIFIENRSGTLIKVLEVLKQSGIQIIASTIADTAEYGIYRLICSEPLRAFEELKKAGVAVAQSDVFAIELDKLLSLPAYPLLDAADLVCEHRAGFSFRKAAPVEALRHSRLPILFIHGTADRLVPFTMMQTLYDASPSPAKEKLVIEKIGHGALYQAKNYFPTVFRFTDKWTD